MTGNVILFGMINKMARTGAPRRHTQAEYLKEASVNSRSYYSFFPYIRDFVQSCGFKYDGDCKIKKGAI